VNELMMTDAGLRRSISYPDVSSIPWSLYNQYNYPFTVNKPITMILQLHNKQKMCGKSLYSQQTCMILSLLNAIAQCRLTALRSFTDDTIRFHEDSWIISSMTQSCLPNIHHSLSWTRGSHSCCYRYVRCRLSATDLLVMELYFIERKSHVICLSNTHHTTK